MCIRDRDLTLQMGASVLLSSEQSYALIIILLTTIYTVKGGMFSVVATEVLQYGIMVLAGLLVVGYSFFAISDVEINSVITEEWRNVFFGWELETHWSDKYQAFNDLIAKS